LVVNLTSSERRSMQPICIETRCGHLGDQGCTLGKTKPFGCDLYPLAYDPDARQFHFDGECPLLETYTRQLADAGSDAYEKDFALSLLSQEQDALHEIEEAIKRIEAHVYGICEMSGQPIPVARLEAIPFARFTVECQTRYEQENKGKNRWEPAQPLMDSEESSEEEGGDESDEEEKPKLKE